MTDALRQTAVLVPAYEPDDRLPPYVRELLSLGAATVVVVDDGSGSDYDAIFEETKAAGADVIRYTPNGGKGHALRVGLQHIEDTLDADAVRYVVTADSDGQHRSEDVKRVAEAVSEDPDSLWLGSRDFSDPIVPPRSRFGNRTTSIVFKLLYGQWVGDTQTGLRGFSRKLMPMMLAAEGDRYEYEMKVLIDCTREDVAMKPVPIATVYENNNAGSHFSTFRDSARVYKVIFGQFFKFVSSSLISFLVDYGCFLLLNYILEKTAPQLDHSVKFLFLHFMLRITLATVGARIISSIVNFTLNKKLVFKMKGHTPSSAVRFWCVVLLNMLLSAGLTSTLHLLLGVDENIIKIPVDLVLFLVSYKLQQCWVFKCRDEQKETNED